MDKLMEFITNKIVIVLIAIVGLLVPGMLTLFIFKRDVFLQLNFIINIILSIAICIPTYSVLVIGKVFGAMLKNNEYDGANEAMVDLFGMPLFYNFCIFGLAILIQFAEQSYVTRPFCTNLLIFTFLMSFAMLLGGITSKIWTKLHK